MIRLVLGAAVVSGVCVSLVRLWKPELATAVRTASLVLLVFLALEPLAGVLSWTRSLADSLGVGSEPFSLLLRLVGTALVSQLAAVAARDASQTALAEGIEFAGRVLILSLSLPLLGALIETVRGMLP